MKKVTFSDNIKVKEMSVDWEQHQQEIKNPQSIIIGNSPLETLENSPDIIDKRQNTNYIFWLGIVILLFTMILFFLWNKNTK